MVVSNTVRQNGGRGGTPSAAVICGYFDWLLLRFFHFARMRSPPQRSNPNAETPARHHSRETFILSPVMGIVLEAVTGSAVESCVGVGLGLGLGIGPWSEVWVLVITKPSAGVPVMDVS